MNRILAGVLFTATLLAGCADESSDAPLASGDGIQPVDLVLQGNSSAPEVPDAVEVHNATYALQPLATPPAESVTVPAGHGSLNVTVEVVATAACFYTNTEPRTDYVEPGVHITSPSGNQTVLGHDTPSSCDALGTFPRRLDLKTVSLVAEEGAWSMRILTTGQNVEVRLIVRAGTPPPAYT